MKPYLALPAQDHALPLLEAATPAELAEAAADRIWQHLQTKPDLVLCAATGATPTDTYRLLVARRAAHPEASARLRIVKLDEWHGLPMDHPSTCEAYLQEHLVRPLGVTPDRYLSFVSDTLNPHGECKRVSAQLQRWGGIDVAVLGLGLNGHLGLNEPGTAITPFAHVAHLTVQTQQHPMLAAAGRPVLRGLTLGMTELLQSRLVLLLVSGPAKGLPLVNLLTTRPRDYSELPARCLCEHPHVMCLADAAALREAERCARTASHLSSEYRGSL